MRLLLIVLLYLFTPLYFAALQAGQNIDPRRNPEVFYYAATHYQGYPAYGDIDMQQYPQGYPVSTNMNRSLHQKKQEEKWLSDVTADRLKNLILIVNGVVGTVKAVFNASMEFVEHPVSQITETGARILRDLFSGYYSHLHQYSQVYSADEKVELTTEVGSGMHDFHMKRKHHIKNALHNNFGISTNDVPVIAVAVSGGGMRSCLSAAGFLAGAEQAGLLDCVMYNAAISGGSWAVGSASYLYAKSHPKVTFTDFKNNLVGHLDAGVQVPGSFDYMPPHIQYPASNGISRNLFRRIAWDQPLSSMDVYGAIIANITLQGIDGWDRSVDGKRFDVKFSDVGVACQQGILPLPMLATVVPLQSYERMSAQEYKWMAFTPLRAGTKDIGGYVPMWAMGRSYIQTQNDLTYRGFSAEYSLSYLLGAYGLASNINLQYLFAKQDYIMELQGFKIPIPIDIVNIKPYPFRIYSFMQDVNDSELAQKEFMIFEDASPVCPIPLPLVANPEDTAADIIIMVDSDLDVVNSTGISGSLSNINRYFDNHNPGVMPVFDPTIAVAMYKQGKVMHVFNDPRNQAYDSNMPVVIYFPFIRNKAFSQTFDPAGYSAMRHPDVQMVYSGQNFLSNFNFKYTQTQAKMVSGLMEFNVKQSMPEIKELLQAYVAHHKKNQPQYLDPKYKEKQPGITFDFGNKKDSELSLKIPGK